MIETFFKTIRSELVRRTIFYTRAQAEQAIARYIGGCGSAWKKNPGSWVIGVEKGPLIPVV